MNLSTKIRTGAQVTLNGAIIGGIAGIFNQIAFGNEESISPVTWGLTAAGALVGATVAVNELRKPSDTAHLQPD